MRLCVTLPSLRACPWGRFSSRTTEIETAVSDSPSPSGTTNERCSRGHQPWLSGSVGCRLCIVEGLAMGDSRTTWSGDR